jgi:DNA-binding transcriptional ArsR family regulator
MTFAEARIVADLFTGLADPTRVLILYRLARGPHHVGRLAGLIGTPMVNMSSHLRVMRGAGLLDDQKQGRRVFYSLRPGVFAPGGGPGVLGTLALGSVRVLLTDRLPARGRYQARAPAAVPEPRSPPGEPGGVRE